MNIAIASGKGGTGKTTIATNLAAYIAEKRNVTLCDLDVEEPNSGLFISAELVHEENKFKMTPDWIEDNCSLCGTCQDVCNFNAIVQLGTKIMVFPQLCHSCYACTELCPRQALPMIPKKMGVLKHFNSGNLSFIESKLDIGEEQAVPLISQTIKFVNEIIPKNEIRIFDSPPGTSCPVIEATKSADLVILVTEPTPFGLHDLKLAVETMRELKKDITVVINKDGIGDNKVIRYCVDNEIPIIAIILNSRRIAELYSTGKLIYNEIPEMKMQLRNIQKYLFEHYQLS